MDNIRKRKFIITENKNSSILQKVSKYMTKKFISKFSKYLSVKLSKGCLHQKIFDF